MEYRGDGDTNCNWCTWNDLQKLEKRSGKVENLRRSWDYPNYGIVQIGQKTEKNPGDLKKLVWHSDSSERPPRNTDVKNSQWVIKIIIIQTGEIAHEKTWIWLRNGYIKRETESFQILIQSKGRFVGWLGFMAYQPL